MAVSDKGGTGMEEELAYGECERKSSELVYADVFPWALTGSLLHSPLCLLVSVSSRSSVLSILSLLKGSKSH